MESFSYLGRIMVGKGRCCGVAEQCVECKQPCGQLHLPGCSLEECPRCGQMLIGCSCDNLSPFDRELIIKALYEKIPDMEMALKMLETPGSEVMAGNSYLLHAIMQYLFENVPHQRRQELDQVFLAAHPQLVPQLKDENGYSYYTANQLAIVFNIPLYKVQQQIDAMVASGQGIRFADGIRLIPIH